MTPSVLGLSQAFARCGLLPVVEAPDVASTVYLGHLLLDEGIPIIEITCRTAVAVDAIRELRKECATLLVGAGTVLSDQLVREMVMAGAQFLLAPSFDSATVGAAKSLNVPIFPGVLTPTDIVAARNAGLCILKLFPAFSLGGSQYLQALASVYPDVTFVPTGGITNRNLAEFLAQPNVIACGSSWLAPGELLRAGRFDEIRDRVRTAVAIAKQFVEDGRS